MGNTLGAPLQMDAQRGANFIDNEMTFNVQESHLKSLQPVP